jgi:hypothetical protein
LNRTARRAASRRLPRAGKRHAVALGDGRTVAVTTPGSGTLAALLRVEDAIAQGRVPDGRDVATVSAWLAAEERRHPT